jgi:hypothetical protein
MSLMTYVFPHPQPKFNSLTNNLKCHLCQGS